MRHLSHVHCTCIIPTLLYVQYLFFQDNKIDDRLVIWRFSALAF